MGNRVSKNSKTTPPSAIAKTTFVDVGWRKADEVVQKIEEQKVGDCKQDLEALLVFAGLFSAVVTAFLVESYKTLRPDPNVTTSFLLGRIASQTSSFSVHNNFINSTSAPLTEADTSPPFILLHAQQINGLWFASLAISLASASYCITVQQWLREFLAMGDANAQSRARIRHFRDPGLAKWGVYNIAAVLPLLLQVSLALFFVGLCYFTADINHTIGKATLGLVIAWASLFVFSTMMLIISARCPYKVPFLRIVIALLPWLDDEDKAKEDSASDLDILLKVDSLEVDDNILEPLWRSLGWSTKDHNKRIHFILMVICHRLGYDSESELLQSGMYLPSKCLPLTTYTALTNMVATIITLTPTMDEACLEKCFFVLFADYKHDSATFNYEAITFCLLDRTRSDCLFRFLDDRVQWRNDKRIRRLFLDRIKGALYLIRRTDDLCATMSRLFPLPQDTNLEARQNLPFRAESEYRTFEREVLLHRINAAEEENLLADSDINLLRRLISNDIPRGAGIAKELSSLVQRLLESPHANSTIYIYKAVWYHASPEANILKRCIQRICKGAIQPGVNIDDSPLPALLVHGIQAMDTSQNATIPLAFEEHTFIPPDRADQVQTLVIHGIDTCHFWLKLLSSEIKLLQLEESFIRLWQAYFRSLIHHLDRFDPQVILHVHKARARECLDYISKLERKIEPLSEEPKDVFHKDLKEKLATIADIPVPGPLQVQVSIPFFSFYL